MKRFYAHLALLFFVALSFSQAIANRVLVKGYVKFTNGSPASGRRVIITTDSLSTANTCRLLHLKITDSNGYYIDTLDCPGNIVKVQISTENCNGTMLVQDPQVPPANVVEANFVVCSPTPANCVSAFIFDKTTNSLAVKFNSSTSSGVSATDIILRRKWTFGNGDTLGGNVVSPVYTYAQRGVYQACLTIWTAAGCEKQSCKTISLVDSVPPPVVQCYSRFSFLPAPATTPSAYTIKFNSINAEASTGDTIKERIWSFGDGSALSGNQVDPTHAYPRGGVYTACLTIKTVKGCQSQLCLAVVVAGNNTTCTAKYTYEKIAPKKIRFNSSTSSSPAMDSIIERKWDFGDGSPLLTGNVISPVKEYSNMGIYNVCLSIKTQSGCLNSFCSTVRVQDSIVVSPTADPVRIVSVSPNPATTQLSTVVFSLRNNTTAELSVYDIYGVKKWGMRKVLMQGNNVTSVPVSSLLSGPYFFRVTTMFGVLSKPFYKL